MTGKELKVLHYENRIAHLGKRGMVNENLIRKAKRQLRKLEK